MSLADVPLATPCVLTAALPLPELGKYRAVGLEPGSHARVLARYPGVRSSYAEVEVDGRRLVTVPLGLARHVAVALSGTEGSR